MIFEIKKATQKDIEYVAANLCKIHKAELEIAGDTPEIALSEMELGLEHDRLIAAHYADKPAVIVGYYVRPEMPDARFIYIYATDVFFDLGPAAIRQSRRYVKQFREMHPDKGIYAISRSPHPEVVRWHVALGFCYRGIFDGEMLFVLA